MTVKQLFEQLERNGVRRVRVIETPSQLLVQVPIGDQDTTYRTLIGRIPAHLKLQITKLPWWKCRFKKQQIISKFGRMPAFP